MYLIGIGLNPRQLTLEALHAIQACERVYAETYTSQYAHGDLQSLEKIIHQKIIPLQRKEMEEENDFLLKEAQKNTIAVLIFGNPLTATTHVSLLQECLNQKINFHIIPGISIFNYRGICGLDEYRFGRTTTLVFPEEGYEPLSTFDIILENKKRGLHTHCLFDLHPQKKRFMDMKEAMAFLEKTADARDTRTHHWIGIGLAGVGSPHQQIQTGHLTELKKNEWNVFPQSLIICGDLTPYEREALHVLTGWKG